MALRIQIPVFGIDFIFNLSPYKKRQDNALKVVHKQSCSVIEARKQELEKSNVTHLNKNDDTGKLCLVNKMIFISLILLADTNIFLDYYINSRR